MIKYYELCRCYVVFQRGIVQLVERWSPKPNVVGSNPATPVYFFVLFASIKDAFFVTKSLQRIMNIVE